MKKNGRWFLAGVFGFTVAMSVWSLATDARAGKPSPCGCPTGGAKVWCDGGARYNNMCLANCAGATGCVEIPILPPS